MIPTLFVGRGGGGMVRKGRGAEVCRWDFVHGRFISAVMNVKMFNMLQELSIQQTFFVIFSKK